MIIEWLILNRCEKCKVQFAYYCTAHNENNWWFRNYPRR